MIPGLDILGEAVLAGPSDIGPVETPVAWAPVVLDPAAAGQYLVEIDTFTGESFRLAGPDLGFGVLGEAVLAAPDGEAFTTDGGVVRLTYADRDWHGAPDDPAASNAAYTGRVLVPLRVRRSLPIEPEDEAGIVREYGETVLAAADGALDGIVPGHAIDGRRVRILFGPYMGRYADFRAVADALGDRWENDGETVRAYLRDRNHALDKPLQIRVYEGTGGGEGTDQLEGLPLPRVWGRRRNIRPDFVDPTVDLYRVNDRPMQAVDAVYDRGAALTADADYASEGALVAASIPGGSFATCLAEGLFRLGSPADGLVTCDVRGTVSETLGGYINTVDQVCLAILRDDAGLGAGDIAVTSFAQLAAIGGEMGWYVPSGESPSLGETLRDICRSVGGFIGNGRRGAVRAGRLRAPEAVEAVFTFTTDNALSLRLAETLRPRFRQRVAFRANGTLQRGEDLAASVPTLRRQELAEEYRLATDFRGAVRIRHPEALDPPVLESPYERRADAEALAASLMDRHGVERRLYELRVRRASFLFDLGAVVRVVWPRLVPEGRPFVIVDIDEDTAAPAETGGTVETATMTLWG